MNFLFTLGLITTLDTCTVACAAAEAARQLAARAFMLPRFRWDNSTLAMG